MKFFVFLFLCLASFPIMASGVSDSSAVKNSEITHSAHRLLSELTHQSILLIQDTFHTSHWFLVMLFLSILFAFISYGILKMFFMFLHQFCFNNKKHSLYISLIKQISTPIALFFFGLILYFGFAPIIFNYAESLIDYWSKILILFTMVCLISLTSRIITCLVIYYQAKHLSLSGSGKLMISILSRGIKITAIILIILVTGSQLGLDVTALIAGAGVLGLAFAFASQDLIANIFGTLVVAADTPYVVGDYIIIENVEGTVTDIGFRSTRLKTKNGYEVIIPNKSIASSFITNVSRRESVRYDATINLLYTTDHQQLTQAMQTIEKVLCTSDGQVSGNEPKVTFAGVQNTNLVINITAWYFTENERGELGPVDFWRYTKWTSQINLDIYQQLLAQNIEFAQPIQTHYTIQKGI